MEPEAENGRAHNLSTKHPSPDTGSTTNSWRLLIELDDALFQRVRGLHAGNNHSHVFFYNIQKHDTP